MIELVIRLPDADALLAFVDGQLAKGMVFLPDAGGVEPLTSCSLVVERDGRRVRVAAEIVYVREEGPGRGVGLQVGRLDDETLARLRALAAPGPATDEADFLPLPPGFEAEAEAGSEAETEAETETETETETEAETEAESEAESESETGTETDEAEAEAERESHAPQLHERLRHLTTAEQQRLAMTGTPAERTLLERLYGPAVWEALLASGRLSPPEVARIARKGTVPRPLLETIGSNGAWLASPQVQRALLSNPRCPGPLAQRILQALPRRELALVPQQAGYPPAVRQAAKALLKR